MWSTRLQQEKEKWREQFRGVYNQTGGDCGLIHDDIRGWLSSEWIPERFRRWSQQDLAIEGGLSGLEVWRERVWTKSFANWVLQSEKPWGLCNQECWRLWWRHLDLEMLFAVCSCTVSNSHPLPLVLNLLIFCFNSSQRDVPLLLWEIRIPLRKHTRIIWIAVGSEIYSDLRQCYHIGLNPLLAGYRRTVHAQLALIWKTPAMSTFGVANRTLSCRESNVKSLLCCFLPQIIWQKCCWELVADFLGFDIAVESLH